MIKKLLFIALGVMLFASCDTQTLEKKDLPIEVVKLKEANSFDTVLNITTDKHVFVFDKNKEYKGRYNVVNHTLTAYVIGIFLGLFIVSFIIWISNHA